MNGQSNRRPASGIRCYVRQRAIEPHTAIPGNARAIGRIGAAAVQQVRMYEQHITALAPGFDGCQFMVKTDTGSLYVSGVPNATPHSVVDATDQATSDAADASSA